MPTIYNAANIQAWKAEASALTASKPAHQAIIAQQKEALEPFKRELHNVQGSIRRLRDKLRPYEVRPTLTSVPLAHRILHPHDRHHHHHYHHVHHRAGLLRILADGISAYQLKQLSDQLQNLERNELRILDNMRPYESKQQPCSCRSGFPASCAR